MSKKPSSKQFFFSSRKMSIVSASAVVLALCAFGAAGVAPLAPDVSDIPEKSITQELTLPSLKDQISKLEESDQSYTHEERVRPGDTLASLFSRMGIDDNVAAAFIKSDRTARGVLQLKPGKLVRAQTSKYGDLQWLSATVIDDQDKPLKNIIVTREGSESFKAMETPVKLEKQVEMRSGEVKSSLFSATDKAQIPDSVAKQISEIFGTRINFATEMHRGDRFTLVYETLWQNGEYVGGGRILAGEYTNAGKTYQAVWFNGANGAGYYDFDGNSIKKAFLKSPIEFSRISSGFAMRNHPIFGDWRQHRGVDFAAPVGTPIHAAGDGVVDFAGDQSGYGNMVVLQHWDDYSTAYAHMSGFAKGIKKGLKINQGQVIGYVGTTGWTTGSHLHYELRRNDEPQDPLAGANITNDQPLSGADLQRFRTVAAEMNHRITLLRTEDKNIRLASK